MTRNDQKEFKLFGEHIIIHPFTQLHAMKKTLAIVLLALTGTAFGSNKIVLPSEGRSSAESITNCEAQVARLANFKKSSDKTGTGYGQMHPSSDSFVYLFTTPAEPAHPAMIKITLHPMANPQNPQDGDFEFFASYAGDEAAFTAWSKKVLFDFGRGFATGVMKNR